MQSGVHLESAQWWQTQRSAKDAAAGAAIQELADNFKQDYGALGVITGTALGRSADSAGLAASDAALAARQAGLIVIDETVALPDCPALGPTIMRGLTEDLNKCMIATIPELLHPGSDVPHHQPV